MKNASARGGTEIRRPNPEVLADGHGRNPKSEELVGAPGQANEGRVALLGQRHEVSLKAGDLVLEAVVQINLV